MKNWNKNINVPNALSLFRIVLIGPFVYYFLHDQILPAAICLVLSGLSDMFDGMSTEVQSDYRIGKMPTRWPMN
ncbi:MAG: CDP-alcohol phosphatidyltransferase family protein [Anaeromassilibacillus sp.]